MAHTQETLLALETTDHTRQALRLDIHGAGTMAPWTLRMRRSTTGETAALSNATRLTWERRPASMRYKPLIDRRDIFVILPTSCNICTLRNKRDSHRASNQNMFVIMLHNRFIHQHHSCLSAANCFNSSSDTFFSAFSFVAFKKILGTMLAPNGWSL
jgi:hypothetical protein